MDELERFARRSISQQRSSAEQDAFKAETDVAFSPAREALDIAHSFIKTSLENGDATISKLWPVHENVDEISEIDVAGPWIPYVTAAGPVQVRLHAAYRDIRHLKPYLHKSVSLEVEGDTTMGVLAPHTVVASIWSSDGEGLNGVGIQIGSQQNVNPQSPDTLKLYDLIKFVAAESVSEE